MNPSDMIDAIRKALVPVHREGWPFVGGFFVAAVVLGWLWDPFFWIGLALTAWCAYFFRDPQRIVPVSDDFVLAPADGKIASIGRAQPPREAGLGDEPLMRVSIFMNVFDTHINRAPMRGRVSSIAHKAGSFANAELDKASTDNERNTLVLATPKGDAVIVQIAGLVARRIVCWAAEGEELSAGERFGLIRFGSRVDLYLPDGAEVTVSLGQTAIAGETILARYDGAPVHPVTRIA